MYVCMYVYYSYNDFRIFDLNIIFSIEIQKLVFQFQIIILDSQN